MGLLGVVGVISAAERLAVSANPIAKIVVKTYQSPEPSVNPGSLAWIACVVS